MTPTYPGHYAALTPAKPAVIAAATGDTLTYAELDRRSSQFAQLLHAIGLRRGDRFAVVMENNIRFFEIAWAALRSGLVMTPVNRYLTPGEVAYIVEDSEARAVVSSLAMRQVAGPLTGLIAGGISCFMVDGVIDGWASYEEAIARHPAAPLDEEWMGAFMPYTSGTTGRPKGVAGALPDFKVSDELAIAARHPMFRDRYGFDSTATYLSTAPLYHAAPLSFAIGTHCYGGTVVFLDRFEPTRALASIERYRVTHSQWVPTMFIRMLKLTADERGRFDLSSQRAVIHAAAPCPVDAKRQMIEWWGPIIHEFYGGSEGNGLTAIDSREWLDHPGSVGRQARGILHICDDEGNELPPGERGLIYFESPAPFHYHNAPEKTQSGRHPKHDTWSTIGDIGYVDADGYLYLTDRQSFMIISGGVNIYPQAIEDALVMHPKVGDAAVIGVPDPEMGEAVKAIIEPAAGVTPGESLADELVAFLQDKVAKYMLPRSVNFIDVMPRLATGKLHKQTLRDRYSTAA